VEITLDWLGCATFRLRAGDLVVYLDAYMDRVPTAPPVGLSAAEVDRADFVLVGHSHFDHLAGAEVIARNTGAKVIGSNETCRVMRECGVPGEQLLPSQGGERHLLAEGVTVRVFPSLHACLWAGDVARLDDHVTGDAGLCEHERAAVSAERNPLRGVFTGENEWGRMALEHMRTATGSVRDGGPLVYLIETPAGSVFYQDTSGCWSGVLQSIRADAAILALSARPNLDGEPMQGSALDFLLREIGWLQPKTLVLGHHDNWLGNPEFEEPDLGPLRDAVGGRLRFAEGGYLAGTRLL
jgi:hypothetical protein